MSLAEKLQIKPGQSISVIEPRAGFDLEAEASGESDADGILIFVKDKADLARHQATAVESARDDRLTWIAYPKAGQLDTDLNRDILWELLQGQGVKPVRQVAVDDTWSALRFRPA